MRNRIPWVVIAYLALVVSCALSLVIAAVLFAVYAFKTSVLLGLLVLPWTILLPIILAAVVTDVACNLME